MENCRAMTARRAYHMVMMIRGGTCSFWDFDSAGSFEEEKGHCISVEEAVGM